MNVHHGNNFQQNSSSSKPTTLSRRSAGFLYPSEIKESTAKKLMNYSLNARNKAGYPIALRGGNSNMAYKVVRSPYSLKINEYTCAIKGVQCSKTQQQLHKDRCPNPPTSEYDSKENECFGDSNQRSPVLRSRRFRRKAMKKYRLGASRKSTDNIEQRTLVTADTPCNTSKSADCQVSSNGDPLHAELSSIDFSKIFSECFSQASAETPIQGNLKNTAETDCFLSEMNEIAPAISKNDANNTFDSMFSCTDEELLACVCDDFDQPEHGGSASDQVPENPSSVNGFTARHDTNFKSTELIHTDGKEDRTPVFGFATASRKEIKISKAALQKAENLLCYDCFGDPL